MIRAIDQNFEAAYEDARELTVFWCPLIDPDNLKDVPREPPKIECPKDLIEGAQQLIAQNSTPDSLVEQITGIYGSLLPRESNSFSLTVDNRDDIDSGGLFKAELDNLADAPETLAFCLDPAAQVEVSFGLWKTRDDWEQRKSRWFPEINICRTYSEKPAREVFESHLKTYGEKMGQAVIHFKTDGQSWFYDPGKKPPFYTKQEVRWILTTTTQDPWTFQFQAIVEGLNRRLKRHTEKTLQGLKDSNDFVDLGATAERYNDNHALKLSIAGCSSYLFSPFFEEVLDEDVAVSFDLLSRGDYTTLDYRLALRLSDAILLEVRPNDHSREVLYAFYSLGAVQGSTLTGGRCLCGRSYPRHRDPVDSSNIANLRTDAAGWIKEQYELDQDNRGEGWSWRLLSSPHFYFATEQELLADENTDKTAMKQCEDEALKKAKRCWEDLLTGFFEGLNQRE